MKTLIYQYWLGQVPLYAEVSKKMFQEYAIKVGADYRFDENPSFFKGKYGIYYHALRPLFDKEFHEYDRVLYVDMDVYPSEKLSENIFDLEFEYLAMALEPDQPEFRSFSKSKINLKNDIRWAKIVKALWNIILPTDELERPLVFNAGVLLYSKDGMKYAFENFMSIKKYVWAMGISRLPRFYRNDQNYLHTCSYSNGFNLTTLSNDWNSIVHYYKNKNDQVLLNDMRNSDTKFIHLQARDRSEKTAEELVEFVHKLKK